MRGVEGEADDAGELAQLVREPGQEPVAHLEQALQSARREGGAHDLGRVGGRVRQQLRSELRAHAAGGEGDAPGASDRVPAPGIDVVGAVEADGAEARRLANHARGLVVEVGGLAFEQGGGAAEREDGDHAVLLGDDRDRQPLGEAGKQSVAAVEQVGRGRATRQFAVQCVQGLQVGVDRVHDLPDLTVRVPAQGLHGDRVAGQLTGQVLHGAD